MNSFMDELVPSHPDESNVKEAKSWNFQVSLAGIDNQSVGQITAKIRSEMGLLIKPAVKIGQGEFLHRILARSHSKKMWFRVSTGLYKRTTPDIRIFYYHIPANVSL
ncbi:hypothetical protein SLA2020_425370 [Shorea laevis]